MRKLLSGKVRDTSKMEEICGRSGDSNDCYGTYSHLMRDQRDGKFFHWAGHHWAGLGEDTLELVVDAAAFIEEEEYTLDADEAARVESLLTESTTNE